MADGVKPQRVALLWQLGLNDASIACGVYRDSLGLELRVESASAVIVRERFDLQPRVLARAQTLREALQRRGWTDSNSQLPSSSTHPPNAL
jgi:hypothetical protein